MLGTSSVAYFSVVQRVFSVGLLSQYIMLPLWPVFREAIIRGDIVWAGTTLHRALRLNVVIGGVGGAILLVASRWVLKSWAGIGASQIDGLRLGFVIWIVLAGYIATMNAFLNQPGVMKRHLVLFGTATIVSVALKVLFISRWGVAGVVWATIIGYSVVYVIPSYRLAIRTIGTSPRSGL